MGVSVNALRFLLEAEKFGVSFTKTITIGRQNLRPNIDKLAEILGETRNLTSDQASEAAKKISDPYVDNLFKFLGAETIESLDFSDYENATIIHDMNQPISQELKSRYDVVLDGGSLEHIFNFPVAVKNCLEMVKNGGHFMVITPANNHCGHGFYQFSPELYFRILSEENGFEVVRMLLIEENIQDWQSYGRWFGVLDPNILLTKAELINDKPVLLLAVAKKIRECEIFRQNPHQSYYVKVWEQTNTSSETSRSYNPIKSGVYNQVQRLLSPTLFKSLVNVKRKLVGPKIISKFSFENEEHYKPIKIP